MARDENDAVIVRSTIDLAHNLGYRVVAEGVEDEEARDLLEILGCDSIQGYFVSVPQEAGHFEAWNVDPARYEEAVRAFLAATALGGSDLDLVVPEGSDDL